MRLIDSDALMEAMKEIYTDTDRRALYSEVWRVASHAPAIDAVLVVRCKECAQWDEEQGRLGRGWCGVRMCMTRPEWYCWDGERGEADADTP